VTALAVPLQNREDVLVEGWNRLWNRSSRGNFLCGGAFLGPRGILPTDGSWSHQENYGCRKQNNGWQIEPGVAGRTLAHSGADGVPGFREFGVAKSRDSTGGESSQAQSTASDQTQIRLAELSLAASIRC